MPLTTKSILITCKEYLIISIGIFLSCFAWTSFLIPMGIAGGGSTGLSTVIYFATGGSVPVSVSYLVVNTILVVSGILILGKGFGFKTIYCILLATVLYQVLPDLIPWHSDLKENFLNAILGGLIGAVGISIVFSQGGSTGGTDIVALIMGKFREISPGRVYLYCDLVIIGSLIFIPGKTLEDVVYGYIQMVTFSFSVDWLLTGSKQSVQVMIFSNKYEELADALLRMTKGGVSVMDSIGWYSKENRKVVITIARKYELNDIKKTVKNIDRDAFMSVAQTMSVYGRGFDEIKGVDKIEWKQIKKQN